MAADQFQTGLQELQTRFCDKHAQAFNVSMLCYRCFENLEHVRDRSEIDK